MCIISNMKGILVTIFWGVPRKDLQISRRQKKEWKKEGRTTTNSFRQVELMLGVGAMKYKRAPYLFLFISLLKFGFASVDAFMFSTSRSKLPPPPCPKSNPADDVFRKIRRTWPVPLQHWLTTSGVQRSLQDFLFVVGLPVVLKENTKLFWDFFHLSTSSMFRDEKDSPSNCPNTCMTKLKYGDHNLQYMDIIEPVTTSKPNGVVLFVHGGGWGSGKSWMYRLCALPFVEKNKAVAVINYRTYPSADVNGQALDVGRAIATLANKRSDLLDEKGRVDSLVGHSSGAHISLLHVLESAKKSIQHQKGASAPTPIRNYIGLSGVYCIPTHYKYETGRGVEQLSAMRVACGPEEKLHEASGAFRLKCMVQPDSSVEECTSGHDESISLLDDHVPDFLFIHGTDDKVVDYNQSINMVDSIRSVLSNPKRCKECLLKDVGHADTVIHLMTEGVTREVLKSQMESEP